MRELLIDFNIENPLSGGADAGYIGENNATQLVIKPSEEILNSGSSFFVAVFLTDGKLYRSEQFEPAEEIRIMLGAHLTQDHYLSMQLEGYSETDTLIYKSPMVSKIHFMPSIEGKECEEDASDYTRNAQIEFNANKRHSHENSKILENLSDSGGMLTYNGEPVGTNKKEKSIILSYENSEVDSTNVSMYGEGFKIISYETPDTFQIQANSEIVSVELQIEDENCPEWLDLRDMFMYDIDKPYIVNYSKPFYTHDYGLVIASVYFLKATNLFYDCLAASLLRKVRITYIENQES